MKENLKSYALWNRDVGTGIRVEADGELAARTNVRQDGKMDLFLNTHWTYMNLNWGNYERPAKMEKGPRGSVKVRFWKANAPDPRVNEQRN
jgi:hypothetical protein